MTTHTPLDETANAMIRDLFDELSINTEYVEKRIIGWKIHAAAKMAHLLGAITKERWEEIDRDTATALRSRQ